MPIPSRITDPPFHADSTVLDGVDPNPPPYGIITAARLICEYSTVDHLAVKSKAKNQSPDQVPGHMAMEMEPRCGPLARSQHSVPSGQDAPFEELSALKVQKPFPLHASSLSLFSVAIRKALIDSDKWAAHFAVAVGKSKTT
ncbi:hypothetical protein LB506_007208 [Fusarium annulatum]|nr:hypothetical protein LB506_007208 [Fusarium annulatum]